MQKFEITLTEICDRYRPLFGPNAPAFDEALMDLIMPVLEAIANNDAPYHTVEQTLQAMTIGQLILAGKQHFEGNVSPKDWLALMVALGCHDVGYVKGLFEREDRSNHIYYDGRSSWIKLPPDATGAALVDCHVDRSKAYAAIHLIHPHVHLESVQEMIEMTRFPIPHQSRYQHNLEYPGLCRAADLLGQICDPSYLKKLPALFCEFEESGMNRALGYVTPENLETQYPTFFWRVVYPYVKGSMRYLSATAPGRRAIAQLYTNLCLSELDATATDAPMTESGRGADESQFLPWQEAGFLFFS